LGISETGWLAQLSFIAQGMNDLRMGISELLMPFVARLSIEVRSW